MSWFDSKIQNPILYRNTEEEKSYSQQIQKERKKEKRIGTTKYKNML